MLYRRNFKKGIIFSIINLVLLFSLYLSIENINSVTQREIQMPEIIKSQDNYYEIGGWSDVWGELTDVFVDGDYSFVASGHNGLLIINTTEKTTPELLSTVDFDGYADCVYVYNHFVFIGGEANSEVLVIYAFDLSNPVIISRLDTGFGGIEDIIVVNNYLFISKNTQVKLYDISDHTNPVLLWVYDDPSIDDDIKKIDANENYFFISDYYEGFSIVNYTTETPTKVGQISCSDSGYFYLDENKVYLSTSNSIKIIDITNISEPIQIGSYSKGSNCIQCIGNYLYIIADPKTLEILDVSNPSLIQLEGSYNDDGNMLNFFVQENFVYIVDYIQGFEIIDVSDKTTPVEISEMANVGLFRDVFISGEYAFISNEYSGLKIINVSNPINPKFVYNIDSSVVIGDETYSNEVRNVFVVEKNLFFTTGAGVFIYDISDITNPIKIWEPSPYDGADGIFIEGNLLYLTAGSYIKIYDISSIDSPILLGTFDNGDTHNVWNIAVEDNIAYITDYNYGLGILNVSDPTNITKFKTFSRNWANCLNLHVKNNIVYLADESDGMEIINVTDPANPELITRICDDKIVYDVTVKNEIAYLACESDGVHVYNISNFKSPEKLGYLNDGGFVRNIFVDNNLIYLSDVTQGLEIISGDLDQDGLSDYYEGIYGTDIENPDTDADLLSDGEEVYFYFTDPTLWDTDSDGFSDYEEVVAGTDPNDSSSFPEIDNGLEIWGWILIGLGGLVLVSVVIISLAITKRKSILKQMDNPISEFPEVFSCNNCGYPIEHNTIDCPECGEKIIRCVVCKLPCSLGDEIGKCSLCEAVGHLEHMQEWVKEKGKCPVCLQELPYEGIIIETSDKSVKKEKL